MSSVIFQIPRKIWEAKKYTDIGVFWQDILRLKRFGSGIKSDVHSIDPEINISQVAGIVKCFF